MIQDPELYKALCAAMKLAEDGTRALGLADWQHLIAVWNPHSRDFHMVLCSPSAEKIMGMVAGIIHPASDGASANYVAPPEIVQLLDALREEEGATVTLAADNPDFNELPEAVIYVCGSWTDWQDIRLEGSSVLECLRDALRRKETAPPSTRLLKSGAEIRLMETLRWQRQLAVTEIATAIRRSQGNVNHPDVIREIRRLDALDALAAAYEITIEKPPHGKLA